MMRYTRYKKRHRERRVIPTDAFLLASLRALRNSSMIARIRAAKHIEPNDEVIAWRSARRDEGCVSARF
jgi:hypothetical protein